VLPYFELREISLWGSSSIASFGALVFVGVVSGAWFAQRRADALGVERAEIGAAILWALGAGFLGSHLEAVVQSDPGVLARDPLELLRFWNGMSSFGGFFGALVGLAIHFRGRVWLRELDILIQGLVVGWVFGRLGCTLVHDHVGRLSDFALAIRFPAGARHDLGFYEFLYTALVLVPAVFWINRAPRRAGTTVWVMGLLYAPARFAMDFLRQTDLPGADARYLGLTAAQYACMASLAIGLAVWQRTRHRRG
jgi:phosphatidylglycerol:prolipoprotein diacylglycerol transferase